MKKIHTLTLAALMGFSSLVLATEPPAAVQKPAQPADTSCRNVTSLAGVVHSYCGSTAQWAKFDAEMAKLDKGFSCRTVKELPQQLCLFARQWQNLDLTKLNAAAPVGNIGFGGEANASAVAINRNEYAAVSQDLANALAARPVVIP